MISLEYEWRCILAAMDKFNGWNESPAGKREKTIQNFDDLIKSCKDWFKKQQSVERRNTSAPVAEISVARQGSTVQRK